MENAKFSDTQILREINLRDSRSSKSAILTHLEDLNLKIDEFLAISEGSKASNSKFRASKTAKNGKF